MADAECRESFIPAPDFAWTAIRDTIAFTPTGGKVPRKVL
jgi:hypothetical protein